MRLFKPTHSHELGFMIGLLIAAAVAFLLVNQAYLHGWLVTLIVAELISWISMQLLAATFEHRWMWPASTQYPAFFWGDLLCLPAIAVVMSIFRDHQAGPTLADNPGWRLICVIVGVIVGVAFHLLDSSGDYTPSQLHSPTKLWHDLFVFPVFISFLVSQVPLVVTSGVGISGGLHGEFVVLVVVLVAALIGFGIFAIQTMHQTKPLAHVGYDWEHFRPVAP